MKPSSWFDAGGDNELQVLWEDGERVFCPPPSGRPHRWLGARGICIGEATGVMTNPVERYRMLAAHCVRLARHTANSRDKALLLQMAESWVRLAERAETREITDDSDEEK